MALAYRSTREAGGSHHDAMGFAMMAYYEERPEAYADRVAASHQVAVFISSAINADPVWFWRNVRKGDYWAGQPGKEPVRGGECGGEDDGSI